MSCDTGELCEANQSFLCELYKNAIEEKTGENIFISPFSISMALSMTLVGTQENTKAQMKKTLGFGDIDEHQLHSSFKLLLDQVTSSGNVSIANGLFVQERFQLLSTFVNTVQQMYNAISRNVDFQKNAAVAVQEINEWVKEKTKEKIPQLLENIDPLTVLVIINAIYFKSLWSNKFDPKMTTVSPFHISEHDTKQVKMMHLSDDFRYYFNSAADCEVLELPYEDKKTSMIIILPKKIDGLSKVESLLSPVFLKDCLLNLRGTSLVDVDVDLPCFKLEESYNLSSMLKSMGMTDLFTPHVANMKGITQKSDLYVSEVIHKSVVEVNEEGTEAAAATAVAFVLCCLEIAVPFKADHPFIFFIIEKNLNNILFIGSLKNPPSI